MHFCVFATRGHGAVACPRKIGLNWFIPALVNSSVGSSCGTTGELGTNVCPCFSTKKSMNCWRISWDVMGAVAFGLRVKEADYLRRVRGGKEGVNTKGTKNT